VDRLLVDTAAAGADLEDLAVVAAAAYARWRQQQPDPDDPDGGYDERYLKLGTTIDNAGRITGDLTPECTAAVQAVLEALGKKQGPEDDRTGPQRFHDALQLACELLIRAKMVPDRAGAGTHAHVHIGLAQLLTMEGAAGITSTWLAALAGQPGYLAGQDAEAAACDALIVPVVTGQPDLTVVDKMIGIVLAYLDPAGRLDHGDPAPEGATGCTAPEATAAVRSGALSPEAWSALRYAMARLAVDLVSGPAGLAAILRQGLLPEPFNSRSIPLDIGWSRDIPANIRRAVVLRDRHCAWPGCRQPPSHCDVHHLRHKRDGGETSLWNCALLCQFHHDVCIHRRGWRLVLHPTPPPPPTGRPGKSCTATGHQVRNHQTGRNHQTDRDSGKASSTCGWHPRPGTTTPAAGPAMPGPHSLISRKDLAAQPLLLEPGDPFAGEALKRELRQRLAPSADVPRGMTYFRS
jgi:hypothetical protein